MVLLAYHAAAARQGLGALMIAHLEGRHVAGATLVAVIMGAATAQSFGLVMLIAVAALAMGMKFYFHRRLDGITGDICGAAEELSETSVLVLCACGLR
jgi:adenosylcobinamide-GDP ribazoletransferase